MLVKPSYGGFTVVVKGEEVPHKIDIISIGVFNIT